MSRSEAGGLVDRGRNAGSDGASGSHENIGILAKGGDRYVHTLKTGRGAHHIAVVKSQHQGILGLGVKNSAETVLHAPVSVAKAFCEKAGIHGGHIKMVIFCDLISYCISHFNYSLKNTGVCAGVFHRRSISSSHFAIFSWKPPDS